MTNFLHENVLGDIELNTINENGKRLYVTPDGEKYPSVTTVLSEYKKQGIIEWRPSENHKYELSSGIYFISLETEVGADYQKISYIK